MQDCTWLLAPPDTPAADDCAAKCVANLDVVREASSLHFGLALATSMLPSLHCTVLSGLAFAVELQPGENPWPSGSGARRRRLLAVRLSVSLAPLPNS